MDRRIRERAGFAVAVAVPLLVPFLGAALLMGCERSPRHAADGASSDDVREGPSAIDAAADGGGETPIETGIEGRDGGASAGETGRGRTVAEAFVGALHLPSFTTVRTTWSSSLAVAAGVIVATNADSDSITVVDEDSLEVLGEIPVGDDPRGVALTEDGRYAVVVNRGDGSVSMVDLTAQRELYFWRVGAMPYAVALAGSELFVTEMARGNLAVLDVVTRTVTHRIAVGDSPAGIAGCFPPRCTLPGDGALLITHFYSGALTVVDHTSRQVIASISTGADTNLSQFVAVSPDGGHAYLPQTRSNADNPNRQFDTTVFPVVNAVELAPAAAALPRLVNAARVTLDTADRPVGMPFALEFSGDGQLLWVVNAASDDLSVIDLNTLHKVAHVEVGAHPRALRLSSDGERAYVHETMDGTLAVVAADTFEISKRVTLTRLPLDAVVLAGKKLFHSAQRTDLAKDQWMACATCHFDNLTDRRTWLSFPDGPRNTTALFNLGETLPLHWSGDLDEVEDVEATVRFIQAGTGLAPAPRIDTLGAPLVNVSADLHALAVFLRAIPAPPSPFRDDPPAIARGETAFAGLGCVTCHSPPHYTDRKQHDVGTGVAAVEKNSHGRGTTFDTPSLRALWLTPPFLHDGSAGTLDDVLSRGPIHDVRSRADAATRQDLVAFLRAL